MRRLEAEDLEIIRGLLRHGYWQNLLREVDPWRSSGGSLPLSLFFQAGSRMSPWRRETVQTLSFREGFLPWTLYLYDANKFFLRYRSHWVSYPDRIQDWSGGRKSDLSLQQNVHFTGHKRQSQALPLHMPQQREKKEDCNKIVGAVWTKQRTEYVRTRGRGI
ncbi:hypothetical protein RRG08_046841 [Elysia crispata]|uniref:Uncharacterized protein n=1 Tax=Elysia crispata TaxID=231223 RepID=A0AAE0ZNU8_9GAST|nr:hypothetical protein RRG08_046841 [Elysia crispata]